MAYQIPVKVRVILQPLAEAVFPIQAWIKQKPFPKLDQLIPKLEQLIPPVPSVPWRSVGADPTLSTASFEIVAFLELLSDKDSVNVALAPRWNEIRKDPTKYFRNREGLPTAQWRQERGLLPDVKFGAFEPDSSNFAFVTQGQDGKPESAISRDDFYDLCWPLLVAAYDLKPPADAAGWVAFRDNLRANQFVNEWPISKPVRSSAFIRQFTIDVLNACLGQKNGAIAGGNPIFQRAVLIELGENRHRGNKYTVQQAAQAVATFTNTI